jgi:hypothetical protein
MRRSSNSSSTLVGKLMGTGCSTIRQKCDASNCDLLCLPGHPGTSFAKTPVSNSLVAVLNAIFVENSQSAHLQLRETIHKSLDRKTQQRKASCWHLQLVLPQQAHNRNCSTTPFTSRSKHAAPSTVRVHPPQHLDRKASAAPRLKRVSSTRHDEGARASGP